MPSWKVRDLPLVAEAVAWLFLAWLVLKLLPFRRIAPLLRPPLAQIPAPPDTPARIRWAILAAARRVPWRAVCFHQGIAAQRMLCRRGISAELCYGVAKSWQADGVDAHVWVTAAGNPVVGGEVAERFTVLATFGPGDSSRG